MINIGIFLNPNNKRFIKSRNNPLYVDKSLLIEYTNSHIDQEERFLLISRPRRFGKSTDAKMLVAYYSKGCDSHALFDDLKISQTTDYYEHLNSHNVILIDMQAFYDKDSDIKSMIRFLSSSVLRDLFKKYKDVEYRDSTDLPNCLDDIYDWHTTNKKYGNESALNMFKEITMISPTPFERFMGFTEDEVKELCIKHDMDFNQMKSWYDGYHIDNNVSLYNPRSIVFAITDRKYGNYWTDTGTFEVLISQARNPLPHF